MKTATILCAFFFSTLFAASFANASPQQKMEVISVEQLELTENDEGRPVIFLTAKLADGAAGANVEMAIPAGSDPIKVVVPRHRAIYRALEAARNANVSFSVSGEHSTRGGHTMFQVKSVAFEIQ